MEAESPRQFPRYRSFLDSFDDESSVDGPISPNPYKSKRRSPLFGEQKRSAFRPLPESQSDDDSNEDWKLIRKLRSFRNSDPQSQQSEDKESSEDLDPDEDHHSDPENIDEDTSDQLNSPKNPPTRRVHFGRPNINPHLNLPPTPRISAIKRKVWYAPEDPNEVKPYSKKNELWKKSRFNADGYKFNGALIGAGLAATIVGAVVAPVIVVPAAIFVGVTTLSTIASLTTDKTSTAKLDNIIKYSKISTAAFGAATAAMAVGGVFFPPLLISSAACGGLTAISATVQNRANKHKSDLFREIVLEVDLSRKGNEHELSKSPVIGLAAESSEYQSSKPKRFAKLSAKVSALASKGVSALPAVLNFPKDPALRSAAATLGPIAPAIAPVFSTIAAIAAGIYERKVEQAGVKNIDRASVGLRAQYMALDLQRYELANDLAKSAFRSERRNNKIEDWIEFYLFRAVFESKLTNQELMEDPEADKPQPSLTVTAALASLSANLSDTKWRNRKEALEQIDDWSQNQNHKRYTKREKLAVLDALPVLRMMAIDTLTEQVRGEEYTKIINQILEDIKTGNNSNAGYQSKFKIDIESTDRKKAFGFYLRQTIIECYDSNLIFGEEAARNATFYMVRRNIEKYLEYESKPKPTQFSAQAPRDAIPSKSRLIEFTQQDLSDLSKKDQKRLKKLSHSNPHYLEQVSKGLTRDVKNDQNTLLELFVYNNLQDQKLTTVLPYRYTSLASAGNASIHRATNPAIKQAMKQSLKTQEEKPLPNALNRGFGALLGVVKINGKFALKILEISSPEIQRFRFNGNLVDNDELKNGIITSISWQGRQVSMEEFVQDDGEVDLVAIRKCFSGNQDVGFICDGKRYTAEDKDRKIFATRDCEGLKNNWDRESYGEIYDPIKHGVNAFENFRENIKEQSAKSQAPSSAPQRPARGFSSPHHFSLSKSTEVNTRSSRES